MIDVGRAALTNLGREVIERGIRAADLLGLRWLQRHLWSVPAIVALLALMATLTHWAAYPLVLIGVLQSAAQPRSMRIWATAVACTWCVLLWVATGFLAVDPTAWLALQRRWVANDIVGWPLPIVSVAAVTAALAFPSVGAITLEQAISRERLSSIGRLFIVWIFIALAAKFVLGEGTFFIRIFIFAGALIVGNLIRGAVDLLKRKVVNSAKDTVIAFAERESASIENVQAARVAAVVREIDRPVIQAPVFQPAERIISVGGGEARKYDAEEESRTLAEINAALAEERPWPDATLDLRQGISQRDLRALFDGSSEDDYEDGTDPYGLLRHLYDASEAPVDLDPAAAPAAPSSGAEWGFDEAAAASLEIVDEDDADDLSGDGVVEAIASGVSLLEIDDQAEVPAQSDGNLVGAEAPAVSTELPPEAGAVAFSGNVVVAADLDASKAVSRAKRVLAVYRRLKAENRLEGDFAGRLLPLIDDGIEGTLCESEDGRDLIELRARFLSSAGFDDPVEPGDPTEPVPVVDASEGVERVALEVIAEPEGDQSSTIALDEAADVVDDVPAEDPEPAISVAIAPLEASTEGDNQGEAAAEQAVADVAEPGPPLADDDFQPLSNTDITAEESPEMLAIVKPEVADEIQAETPQATVVARSLVDIESSELQRLKEWLALDPLPEHEVDRILDERGRERPDEQEIDYTLRRLKEYAPSPSTRRNAIRQASSLLSKEDESFSLEEVALLKGIVSLGASETFTRWGFQSAYEANRKFVFLFFHDVVSRRVGDIEQRLKDGIPDLEAVTAYRGLSGFTDELQSAFPHLSGMVQDFMALLDRAEYDFAFAGRQDVNLLVEGGLVDASTRGTAGLSVNIGVSRLLASRMPASAQEALSRFISIGKLIEPIDLMIIDEGIRSGDAPEKHPLHPMLMELQYRALLEIRSLLDELKRRPQLRAEIPSIIRTRQEDLGARYEGIVRNEDEIERCVLRNRAEAAQLSSLTEAVASMKDDLAERDRQLQETVEAAKRLPVMDALVSAARQFADRDTRFALVGTSKLKAEVAGGEVAVVFVHGHGMSWQVVNGTKLATEDGAMEIDMIKLCAGVRNTHGFSDDGQTRLRIVMVGGEVGRLTHNCVYSLEEAMSDPGRLLGQAEVDMAAAKALNF